MSEPDLFGGVRHFRRRNDGEEQRSTTLELFFDLVFVFAITQLDVRAAVDQAADRVSRVLAQRLRRHQKPERVALAHAAPAVA